MEKYDIIRRLGGGSFADVFLGKEISTSDMVAIKVLKKKYRKLDQCYELREVVSLQKLCKDSLSSQKGYDNIIKLKEVIFEKKTGKLSLVFEYMETDLYELMKKRSPSRLSEDEIKDITYQMLLGLYHMHKYGFFHRDMKPENLLLTGKKVKIADFGLAREIRSIPPFTEYVSTRYYRAPECILRSQNYNSPVDIWAVGCIMAEMYMHPMPLFYGSSEKEVFIKICTTLGSPNKSNWNEGVNQASKIGMKYPQSSGTDLANIVIGASPEAIDLMKQMLKWAPSARSTAANLLNHPFFNGLGYDLKRVTNSNFFNDFGDVKAFNKTNRRFRPNNNNNNEEKNEKINKKDNEDNMFSKLVNDTKGFNKLLDQLKKEENEENKNFEKNNYKFNNEDKLMSKKPLQYNKRLSGKKVINEEKENENESFNEDDKYNWGKKNDEENNNDNKYNDFNFDSNENKFNSSNINNSNKKDDVDEFNYLFNSEKKSSVRNIGIRDNFRKDAFQNKKDEYDYLFDDKKSKEDKYDNLFNKEKEKDFSNIDSEINKILSKDTGLSNNNNNNNNNKFSNNNFSNKNYRPNNNSNISNNDFPSFGIKFKSQKINHNNNINGIGLDKPYERNNLKPLINGGRRGGGGGLMALGYEPRKKSIFENDNLNKGLGINLNRKKETNNNKFGYGFKRDLAPVIMKEKKNENFYDFNSGNSGNNNMFGRKDKFSLYERNNPLFNQFNSGNNDIIGASRRKKNYYSSPNSLGWDLI